MPGVLARRDRGQLLHRDGVPRGVPLACFRQRDLYPPDPDPRLVAGLGIQACEGLHHAHNLKRGDGTPFEVVHRDVSGNNLFATVDGVVKVLDFGIAKVQDASVKTSTGSVKGTYAYMAPEQLRGERLDRRTDVFALGTVLWEMFGRRHLFKRETEFLTFQAITTDPIPDLAELRPDVPPQLGEVIAKALARKREDRYPTARALGDALALAVAPIGGPLSAGAISEEVERAFEPRLRDQRGLIRVAREGGALGLDHEVPRAIGHGTELMTTPASSLSAHDVRMPTFSGGSSPSAPGLSAPPLQRPTHPPMPVGSVRPSRWPVVVLVMDGTVYGWGYGCDGRLGAAAAVCSSNATPLMVTTGATQLTAGEAGCALKDGGVWCWGPNWVGQVGDGSYQTRTSPVALSGLTGIVDLSAGDDHACVVRDDGTVACWGYNGSGQLGDGSPQLGDPVGARLVCE